MNSIWDYEFATHGKNLLLWICFLVGLSLIHIFGTYVTREEAEAVRAEMMKRPATPYQDSTLQDCFRMFKESREYKGRSDKARELYDSAWKYLRPLWHFKIAALYAQDFQNILDKMADNGLSQSMLEKERTLISLSLIHI